MKNYLLLLPMIALMAVGCKKETKTIPLKIGDFYQGGYIFHIYSDGQHGMVLGPASVERIIPWGCNTTAMGLSGVQYSRFGSGAGNTYHIVQNCPDQNGAASLCDTYLINGFNDWFLPSIDEIDSAITKLRTFTDVNISPDGFYWSSTEGQVPSVEAYSYSNASNPQFRRKVRTNKASGGVLFRPARSF